MKPRLCSFNVDLDEIHHYYAIHGLAADGGSSAVYDIAVPRLCRLASSLDVPLTFFAVGEDLDRAASAKALGDAVSAGHSVGNHSQSHLYDLTRRDRTTIADEIDRGASAIERACGTRPRGFRAPGYTITDEVFAVLRELDVTYDSSVFPCPAYMMAKDAAIATYSLLGRPSRSIIDTPAVLTAPIDPYRIGRPYWKRGDGMLELPIQVTRTMRLPYFGTALMMAGPDGVRHLTRGVVGSPLVNIELHGIDVLDETDVGLAPLAKHQRDLRIPLARKEQTLAAVVEVLRRQEYSFVSLDEAAATFA